MATNGFQAGGGAARGSTGSRLLALDAFRGLTIAAMIVVNTPGSWDHVYPPLLHSEWQGCTPTDLIFPFFLFIAGVSMWLSFESRGVVQKGERMGRVLRRSLSIYLVGVFITLFPDFLQPVTSWAVKGVLQRIAICYLAAALACTLLPRRRLWMAATALLLGYWGLVVALGGDDPYARETVFARGTNVTILLSCMTSTVPVILGYLAGAYLSGSRVRQRTVNRLLALGAGAIAVGWVWGRAFPIIKNLFWTSSYVVYTTGFALVLLATSIWIIEILEIRAWARPFVVLGLNPLFIYAVSIVADTVSWRVELNSGGQPTDLHTWLHETVFAPVLGDRPGSLAYALIFLSLHCALAWWLYRRRIVIKV